MLHVGGLRGALYSYILAKQHEGSFILRVEDTDQERSIEGAVEDFLSIFAWAGISPTEGVCMEDGAVVEKGDVGPYIQSKRLEIYQEHANRLVESEDAYIAFDTTEEIDAMREREKSAGNPSPQYDWSVRMQMRNSLSMDKDEVERLLGEGVPHVIRLKVPESDTIESVDLIRKKVSFQGKTVDDCVLLKSDGFPTYHLANVVDDHLMEISLVIRGEEWLPSFPKHLLIYRALGWDPPAFAHVPLLLNADKTKLSKRTGDTAARAYIDKGYLPEALINFLALLGWNPGTTEEVFSLEELIEKFSLDRVQKSGAIFDLEKLNWLQGQWMRRFSPEEFAGRIQSIVAAKYEAAASDNDFESKAALIQDRLTFFSESPEMLSFFYKEPTVSKELLVNEKQKVTEENLSSILGLLTETLSAINESDWNEEHLKNTLFALAEEKDYKKGQILWPLRAALTGLPYSPGAFEVAAALGKEETLRRLQAV